MKFPAAGSDTVSVSFADRAGNRNIDQRRPSPSRPSSEDRPKPIDGEHADAGRSRSKGGRYVIPIKGGYRLPKSVAPKLGCTGEIVFTMKKAKRLVSARTTKLNASVQVRQELQRRQEQDRRGEDARDHDPLRAATPGLHRSSAPIRCKVPR